VLPVAPVQSTPLITFVVVLCNPNFTFAPVLLALISNFKVFTPERSKGEAKVLVRVLFRLSVCAATIFRAYEP
jgi:hypothetical protein